MPSPTTLTSTPMTQITCQLSSSPTPSSSTLLTPNCMSALATHLSLTPSSFNICSHPWKTSPLPSGLVSLTGSMMTTSSCIKVMSMFSWRTPYAILSSSTAMTMKLPVTLGISRSTNSLLWSSGGQVSHSLCESILKAAPCANKTNQTLTPLSLCSPQSSPTPLIPSSRSLVTWSPTSPFPPASTRYWSQSTMALQRG